MTETKQTSAKLTRFTVGSRDFGFVAGPGGYIVTENDFRHCVRRLNENIELRVRMPWESQQSGLPAFQMFSREQIEKLVQPVTSYMEWAHYWGIKDRVAGNYRDFLNSMVEIGADTSAMPKWGEEPLATEESK